MRFKAVGAVARRLEKILRTLRLLGAWHRASAVIEYMRSRAENKEFEFAHLGFLTPPPFLAFDAYGNMRFTVYWQRWRF